MLDTLAFDFRTIGGAIFWIVFPIYLFTIFNTDRSRKICLKSVGWPLLGNYLRFESNVPEKLAQLKKKRGDVFSVYLGSEKVVVLNSEKALREALSNLKIFDKVSRGSTPSPGHKSIFFTHGLDLCPKQRRLANPNFDLEKEIIEEKIQLEIRHFLNLLEGYHGCQLDFDKILDRSTANVTCLLVLGETFQYGDPQLLTLIALLNEISNHVRKSDFHLTFPGMNQISSNNCSDTHAYKKAMEICKAKIEEHRKTFNAGYIRDFIDSNLKEMEEQNPAFTDDFLALTLMDLIVAATDSLSSCIMWCAYAIASYPDVKAKILKEVDVWGQHDTPSFSDYTSMPYVQAFIHEIIRWKTIVPISSLKRTSIDSTVCGYDIPKGTTVLANFWAVNHDPEVWEDPHSFKPERFLKNGKLNQMVSSVSFSLGHERCPGEDIVYKEVFLYIVSIMHKFDIHLLPGLKPNIEREVVVLNRPQNYEICMPLRREYTCNK